MMVDSTEDAPLQVREVPLAEVLQRYELVTASDDYIVVAERAGMRQLQQEEPNQAIYRELGSTGQTAYGSYLTSEYNPELRGLSGLQKFDQMRKGDGMVNASLMLLKTPVLGGRWWIEPASQSTADKNAALFVWRNLTEPGFMTIPWTQVLLEALLMLDFGYFPFEKVFYLKQVDGQQRICWRKFAPRHPFHVSQWNFDRNGGPDSVEMEWPNVVSAAPFPPRVTIPIDKLLVFTHKQEGGNITGVSALRSAYQNWYFKTNLYKIDAIQKERHGIGVPIIKLPPNFTPADASLANQMGRNLRVNEKAHVVLPPLWEIMWAKIEGYPVNPVDSIAHHNEQILVNILGMLPTDDDKLEIYLKATRFVADIVRDTFNWYAIPQLIDYNYSRVGYPRLRYRLILNWRDFSFMMRNFVGADLIRPDRRTERLLRDEIDLPDLDEDSDRVLELRQWNKQQQLDLLAAQPARTPGQLPNSSEPTKSKGAQPGLPRQSPNPPVGAGQRTTGGPTNNSA